MMSMLQIRKDLRDIRYYYSKQKEFETAARAVGMHEIAETAERYNAAVRKAPLRLYDVYVSLYIYNNTQLVLSFDWDCSVEYIRRLNKQLCEFFQRQLG